MKCRAILEHEPAAVERPVKLRRFDFMRARRAVANLLYAIRRHFVFPLPERCAYRRPWLAGFLGLVPGLGQIYNRQYRKAFWLFVVFVAALWLAWATILHPTSYLFIALLICWMMYSFNDAMVTATRIDGQEWPRGYTIASFCALFFYLGVFWSLSQFFLVLVVIGATLYCLYSIFWRRGEVRWSKIAVTAVVALGVLGLSCYLSRSGNPVIHRWVYWSQDVLSPFLRKGDFIYVDCVTYWFRPPRVGEIVYYNPRPYTLVQGEATYVINPYNAIERLVALPGDTFSRDGDLFFRNGKLVGPDEQPLHPSGLPRRFEFKVPEGRYLVLISYGPREKILGGLLGTTFAPEPARARRTSEWYEACLVGRNEILGRCLFIWHPVSRRRWLVPRKAE